MYGDESSIDQPARISENTGGTYVLVIELDTPASIEFGAAGTFDLDAGWYAYAGSAFGPGGLSRADRHRELAAGDRDTRHWHIDYLLGIDESRIGEVVSAAGVDRECVVAVELGAVGDVLPLGASDCSCSGHLVAGTSRRALVERAHRVLEE